MRAALAVLVLAAGCGRIDFDAETHAVDGSTDAVAAGDGASSSCTPSTGDWVLEQVQGNSDHNGQGTLTVMVNATGGGDFIVVAVQGQAPGVATNVFDGAGSIYTRLAGTAGTDAVDTVEIWYASSAGGGANDVSVTSSTLAYAIVMWEFSTPRAAVVDTVAQLSNQAATTTPVAPTITTHCPGEVVVAAAISQANISGIANGNAFTSDANSNAEGWAHLAASNAPAGMQTAAWTSASGSYCSAAAAFIVE